MDLIEFAATKDSFRGKPPEIPTCRTGYIGSVAVAVQQAACATSAKLAVTSQIALLTAALPPAWPTKR